MEGTELITLVVVGVVLVIGVVSFFSGRIGVAAPLALTVVGVGVGAIPGVPHFEVEPDPPKEREQPGNGARPSRS